MWLLFVFTADGKRGQRKSQEASSVSWRRGVSAGRDFAEKPWQDLFWERRKAAAPDGLGTLSHSLRAQTPGQKLQKLKTLDVGKLT